MHEQIRLEKITTDISQTTQAALQALIAAGNAHDDFAFPFGIDAFPSSTDEHSATLLATREHTLVGLLCIYSWSGLELYGLVHPDHRRGGIGQALFQEAVKLAQQQQQHDLSLGCYGSMPEALAFATAQGAAFERAEYSMRLDNDALPHLHVNHADLTLRQIAAAEVAQVAALASQAFEEPEGEMVTWLTKDVLKPDRRLFFIEWQGKPIGTIRLVGNIGQSTDITLFSLLPAYRRRGYGKQILLTSIDMLLAEQCPQISLDVTSTNSNALALYQACGFQQTRKDSYYQYLL